MNTEENISYYCGTWNTCCQGLSESQRNTNTQQPHSHTLTKSKDVECHLCGQKIVRYHNFTNSWKMFMYECFYLADDLEYKN